MSGKTTKATGEPYKTFWIGRVWMTLAALCNDPELRQELVQRKGSDQLMKRLFWAPVMTLTGRLRGRVGFTQNRNTRFQGLAADGAKLAIWKLVKHGLRVIAFIHDEVLVELPVDCDHTAEASRIERIMCQCMEEVTGTVPVACEYALAAAVVQTGKGRVIRMADWSSGSRRSSSTHHTLDTGALLERYERNRNGDADGEAAMMPGSTTHAGALSIGQLAKRWRLSPTRVKGLVDNGLLPGSFAVPAAGRYGTAIRIPLSTVLQAEEKWTVGRHTGHADQLEHRQRRGKHPHLEHFPELSPERDAGCREGGRH